MSFEDNTESQNNHEYINSDVSENKKDICIGILEDDIVVSKDMFVQKKQNVSVEQYVLSRTYQLNLLPIIFFPVVSILVIFPATELVVVSVVGMLILILWCVASFVRSRIYVHFVPVVKISEKHYRFENWLFLFFLAINFIFFVTDYTLNRLDMYVEWSGWFAIKVIVVLLEFILIWIVFSKSYEYTRKNFRIAPQNSIELFDIIKNFSYYRNVQREYESTTGYKMIRAFIQMTSFVVYGAVYIGFIFLKHDLLRTNFLPDSQKGMIEFQYGYIGLLVIGCSISNFVRFVLNIKNSSKVLAEYSSSRRAIDIWLFLGCTIVVAVILFLSIFSYDSDFYKNYLDNIWYLAFRIIVASFVVCMICRFLYSARLLMKDYNKSVTFL